MDALTAFLAALANPNVPFIRYALVAVGAGKAASISHRWPTGPTMMVYAASVCALSMTARHGVTPRPGLRNLFHERTAA